MMEKYTKKYTILKGFHYSNFFPRFFLLTDLMSQKGTIVFDESCKYEIEEESCVNKLFGYCFGFGVHKNSARFGWTYNKEMNEIFIWKYVYVNGKLYKNKIFSCEINLEHNYCLRSSKNGNKVHVEFIIDNEVLDRVDIPSSSFFVTTLGPYFGGHTRAPHKIVIKQII